MDRRPPSDDDGTTVLVRRDALDALLRLFDGVRYGPRGHEPTAQQRADGIGSLITAEQLERLDSLTDAVDGHERHLRLALNGETPTGVCAACARYAVITDLATTGEGR